MINKVNQTVKFERIIFNGLQLDTSEKNRWLLTKKKDICSFEYAEKIGDKIKIACKKIKQHFEGLYSYPSNSTELDIYFCQELSYEKKIIIDFDLICFEMFAISSPNGMIFFPISNENPGRFLK